MNLKSPSLTLSSGLASELTVAVATPALCCAHTLSLFQKEEEEGEEKVG